MDFSIFSSFTFFTTKIPLISEIIRRQSMYTMYSGPEKSYTALRKVTGRSEEECAKRCTEELACDAVKVKQVTGTGNNECALLTVSSRGSHGNRYL